MRIGLIDIRLLETNNGQIDGLPSNPRFIKDDKFEKLKKSIQDDPEMLNLRECLVFPYNDKFVIIGGNMRYRACKELKYKEIPCKVLDSDTSPEKLRAYTIKDNNSFGSYDFDMLANEWGDVELESWGVDLPSFEVEKEKQDLSDSIEMKFKIECECVSEREQEKLFNELTNKGYKCRVLTL